MGQQQLILLVLATVIVGIAIVVGIAAFTENSAKANADAMIQDAVRVANDMQAFKKKPAPFGGQASFATPAQVADVADYTGSTWGRLGYSAAGAEYTNLNGIFTLTSIGAEPVIVGVNAQEGNRVEVKVCGLGDDQILGAIIDMGGVEAVGALPACPTATP